MSGSQSVGGSPVPNFYFATDYFNIAMNGETIEIIPGKVTDPQVIAYLEGLAPNYPPQVVVF